MKKYEIIKMSESWSTNKLRAKVEKFINEKHQQGYEIVAVSSSIDFWQTSTALITICK